MTSVVEVSFVQEIKRLHQTGQLLSEQPLGFHAVNLWHFMGSLKIICALRRWRCDRQFHDFAKIVLLHKCCCRICQTQSPFT